MRRKLRQYDQLIGELIASEEQRRPNPTTLLMVFGDHGQTDDGAHGGALPDEVDSALFVHAPNQNLLDLPTLKQELLAQAATPTTISENDASDLTDVIERALGHFDHIHQDQRSRAHRLHRQVDLAPTLALGLGVPIPLPNVGFFIPDAFPRTGRGAVADVYELARRAFVNAIQVHQYVEAYGLLTRVPITGRDVHRAWDAVVSAYDDAWGIYMRPKTLSRDVELQNLRAALQIFALCREYQALVLNACSSAWTEFNFGTLAVGLSGTATLAWFDIVGFGAFEALADARTWIAYAPELAVFGAALGGAFSDCFAMRESIVLRFVLASYFIIKAFRIQRRGRESGIYEIRIVPDSAVWALAAIALLRVAPLFDLSEAAPGETPGPWVVDSLPLTLACMTAVLVMCNVLYTAPFTWVIRGCWTALAGSVAAAFVAQKVRVCLLTRLSEGRTNCAGVCRRVRHRCTDSLRLCASVRHPA